MRARIVRSRRVLTRRGLEPAEVHLRDGRILEVRPFPEDPGTRDAGGVHGDVPDDVHDYGDAVIFPGLVDTHVHINAPGRESWEGFATATRAAAAGGVTTVVDMPLNSIPAVTTVEALEAKRAAAEGRCRVDVGFWGGLVPDSSEEDLRALWAAGVLGFKAFLVDSGVPEFPAVARTDLERTMPMLGKLGAPLLVHAEHPDHLRAMAEGDPRSYRRFLASRPPRAEVEAIRLLLEVLEAMPQERRPPLHVVHLATAEAVPLLRQARRRGLPVTVETCPHYLSFCAEEVADGATAFKCAPPLRERHQREQLWVALGRGEIDLVVSDHSPCPPELKMLDEGDFAAAWGGIASLQILLPALWTAARRRGMEVTQVARWLSEAPAALAGLSRRKGRIAPGFDGDLVIWHPRRSFQVRPEELFHRHPVSPYAGRELQGVVEATYLRGGRVYRRGEFLGEPVGELLHRGAFQKPAFQEPAFQR